MQIPDIQEIAVEKLLPQVVKLPATKIHREEFLRKELSKYFEAPIVEKAIATNPAQAGISIKNLEQIAKACINFETLQVTGVSAAAGIPGGFALVATIPGDITQFFAHIVRVLQKLVYLYGWQDLFSDEKEELTDEALTEIILFMGVMMGVKTATAAIAKIAAAAAMHVEKTLVRKALTQSVIYLIVKAIARNIGIKMTKQIFAASIGKVIPVVGAVVSGTITFAGFKPMARRLQKYLVTLPSADVEFYKQANENYSLINVIDVDFSDIDVELEN
jgi:hypothetical protein